MSFKDTISRTFHVLLDPATQKRSIVYKYHTLIIEGQDISCVNEIFICGRIPGEQLARQAHFLCKLSTSALMWSNHYLLFIDEKPITIIFCYFLTDVIKILTSLLGTFVLAF